MTKGGRFIWYTKKHLSGQQPRCSWKKRETPVESCEVEILRQKNKIKYRSRWHLWKITNSQITNYQPKHMNTLSCAFFMASISLPSFDTLADAQKYDWVEVRDTLLPRGSEILPINDIDSCNGRIDCRWCENLLMRIPDEVAWVFLGKESNPSFALCRRWETPELERLISIRYLNTSESRIPPVVQFWSTQCPREFGEHKTN